MKRTALRRLTPLRRGLPMRRSRIKGQFAKVRKSPLRKRRAHPRDRGELGDPVYLAWLRRHPGRSPDGPTPAPSVPHHARHSTSGSSIGAMLKDDRRSISISWENHGHIHQLTGPFRGWTRDRVRAWVDQQIAEQRGEYGRAKTS